MNYRHFLAAVCAVMLTWCAAAQSTKPAAKSTSQPVAKSTSQPASAPAARPAIVVSKETTYVTGPLRPDGSVDFAAALNELAGKGVTKENNAAVPLLQIVGLSPMYRETEQGRETTKEIIRQFGIQPGKLDLYPLAKEEEFTLRRPWKADEAEALATWLANNQAALDTCVQAFQRSRYFVPTVQSQSFWEPSSGTMVSSARALAKLLIARGFLHAEAGEYKEAWRDIQAARQFGTLFEQEPLILGVLGSVAILNLADTAMQRLALHGADKTLLSAMLDDVSRRPAPNLDWALHTERVYLVYANCEILKAFHDNTSEAAKMLELPDGQKWTSGEEKRLLAILRDVDHNEAMTAFNRHLDANDAIVKIKDFHRRQAAARKYNEQQEQVRATLKKQRLPKADASAQVKTQWFVDVMTFTSGLLLPAQVKLHDMIDRSEQSRRITMVALALEMHKREHGVYPKTLDALAPAYLKAVPTDLFSGKALVYKPHDGTYDLYSVGPDGKDDGGHERDDIVSETMRIREEAAPEKKAAPSRP